MGSLALRAYCMWHILHVGLYHSYMAYLSRCALKAKLFTIHIALLDSLSNSYLGFIYHLIKNNFFLHPFRDGFTNLNCKVPMPLFYIAQSRSISVYEIQKVMCQHSTSRGMIVYKKHKGLYISIPKIELLVTMKIIKK